MSYKVWQSILLVTLITLLVIGIVVIVVDDNKIKIEYPEISQDDLQSMEYLSRISIEKNQPSVYGVYTTAHGEGSAFAFQYDIEDDVTYLLTSYHVVKEGVQILVTNSKNERLEATLLCYDERSDIAILEIEGEHPIITWGDSEELFLGQTILALGNPFGFSNSASKGIVSGLHRTLASEGERVEISSALVDVIQTDLTLNPGNSGGPLINLNGEVVGLNSAVYSTEGVSNGIGFSLPSNQLQVKVRELLEKGTVSYPYLGIIGRTWTDPASGLEGGLMVLEVKDSNSNFRVYDRVIAVNGKSIYNLDEFLTEIYRQEVGEEFKVTIIRDDKEKTVLIKTTTRTTPK